ncbi:MAG: hypothetical protein WD063_07065 [Pirellulales bacterium]
MCRKAFFTLVMVSCLPAAAYANPTIWLGNWKINWAANQSIDLNTGNPIAVMIETPGGPPEDQIAGVDLTLTSGPDGVTPLSGPLIESVDLSGPGTRFFPNNTGTDQNFFPFPSLHSYTFTTTASGFVNAGDGAGGPAVLAYLSFDATGLTPGTYPIYLKNYFMDPSGIPTDVPPFYSPTLLDGSVDGDALTDLDGMYGMITVIPEPRSIVLALFAAGGLCAAAIRHRHKHTRSGSGK